MRNDSSFVVVAATLFVVAASLRVAAAADQVHLVNGDVITVTAVDRTETHLVVDHPALGRDGARGSRCRSS